MWMQQGANEHATILNDLILSGRERKAQIEWKSPLFGDDYAEYRDRDFLSKLGRDQLRSELEKFWPSRGPQWDALAVCDDTLLLIEAKAHIGELFSTEMQAGEISAPKIEAAMAETAAYIHAKPRAPWSTLFYQLANRIAHLYFLRMHQQKANLVLINFIGDSKMRGPSSEAEWRAAYKVVWHVLGIPENHKLSADVIEIFPDVRLEPWTSSHGPAVG